MGKHVVHVLEDGVHCLMPEHTRHLVVTELAPADRPVPRQLDRLLIKVDLTGTR
jgi:hypothetical protein